MAEEDKQQGGLLEHLTVRERVANVLEHSLGTKDEIDAVISAWFHNVANEKPKKLSVLYLAALAYNISPAHPHKDVCKLRMTCSLVTKK